MVRLVFVTFR